MNSIFIFTWEVSLCYHFLREWGKIFCYFSPKAKADASSSLASISLLPLVGFLWFFISLYTFCNSKYLHNNQTTVITDKRQNFVWMILFTHLISGVRRLIYCSWSQIASSNHKLGLPVKQSLEYLSGFWFPCGYGLTRCPWLVTVLFML